MAVRKLIPTITVPLVEIIQVQSKDVEIHPRLRGAPLTKLFGTPALLGKAVNDISHDDLQIVLDQYVADRPNRRSGWKFVEEFNALMRWAVRSGYRTDSWVPFRRPAHVSLEADLLGVAEVEKVLQAVDILYVDDLHVQIAIRALVLLGLGVRETTEFSFAQVDLVRSEYHQTDVRRRYRIIPIPPGMQVLIAEAWRRRANISEQGSQAGPWIERRNLDKVIQKLRDHCGFQRLVPSTLIRTALGGK